MAAARLRRSQVLWLPAAPLATVLSVGVRGNGGGVVFSPFERLL
jgi:hypothetical protein